MTFAEELSRRSAEKRAEILKEEEAQCERARQEGVNLYTNLGRNLCDQASARGDYSAYFRSDYRDSNNQAFILGFLDAAKADGLDAYTDENVHQTCFYMSWPRLAKGVSQT